MLYDKKLDKQIKADPFKLSTFVSWLETMPPNGRYRFDNCSGHCLIDQYITAVGIEDKDHAYRRTCIALFGTESDGWPNQRVAALDPQTFGGALKRARNLLTTEK